MTDRVLLGGVERRSTQRLRVPGLRALASPTAALALLLFLAPLMVFIAVAVFAQDRGPVFFVHRRIGRGGRPFSCLKFRSMTPNAQTQLEQLLDVDPTARAEWTRTQKLRHDPRVTPVGAFLRRSSLDELPQLLNVVRGDMSLVGPRPIVETEIARYGRRFRHYCAVKPGLTGLWQISGRSDIDYRRRIAMDSLYARIKSPAVDICLLLRTLPAVLCRRGSC